MTRMRYFSAFVAAVAFVISSSAAAQEIAGRGDGRLGGTVVDEAGKGIEGAVVAAIRVDNTSMPTPFTAKTNNKGEWRINNVGPGMWQISISKDGYAPIKQDFELKQSQRLDKISAKLVKASADPNVEIQAEVQRGNQLLQNKQFAEARKVYEDLMAKYPAVHQLNQFIARSYAAEGNFDKAIEYLRVGVEKDPNDIEQKILLGDLLMEKGQKAEAAQILESVDLTKVKDPFPYINLSITKINEGKADEALALLDKLVTQFPQNIELFYYRGRANLAAKKMPEAKADLEKFVAGAKPDARELPDAKKILEQMKDIK